jgi:hypothetical protein
MLFGFLSPSPYVKRRPRPARLSFESLERRHLLSSAPVVDFLYAIPGDGHTVNISGHVSDFDPNAGPIQVALSGMVQGAVGVDSGGDFNLSGSAPQAGTEQAVAFDGGTGLSSAPFQAPLQNNAPEITGLSAGPTGNGKYVVVSGTVQDESPQGLVVSLSGVVSGSATTDADGGFSLYALASGLGTITATTSDTWGAAATPVTTELSVAPPMVQLDDALADPSGTVTISGYVFGMAPDGDSVTISGVVNGSATPDSSGSFSLTAQASGAGTFTATATDVWGQSSTSAPANVTIYDPPPQLMSLTAAQTGTNSWLISGSVSDPTLGDVVVSFSGSASGSATLDADGNFSFEVFVDPGLYPTPSITVAVSDPANAPSETTIELS